MKHKHLGGERSEAKEGERSEAWQDEGGGKGGSNRIYF
jgi:hypothetical protein